MLEKRKNRVKGREMGLTSASSFFFFPLNCFFVFPRSRFPRFAGTTGVRRAHKSTHVRAREGLLPFESGAASFFFRLEFGGKKLKVKKKEQTSPLTLFFFFFPSASRGFFVR